MSNIKQILQKARILFKTDSVENWNIAENNNFQSIRGELYFYENAKETARLNHEGKTIFKPSLKIGNGSLLKNLDFWRETYITTSQIEELFNSLKPSGILGIDTLGAFYLGQTGSAPIGDLLNE